MLTAPLTLHQTDQTFIAEDDAERRMILRDLGEDGCYEISCVNELMRTHEYKFIRQPKPRLDLEMDRIIEFGDPQPSNDDVSGGGPIPPVKKSVPASMLDPEVAEDQVCVTFLCSILFWY